MDQRKGPCLRRINELSDSRFQRQIRNLPKQPVLTRTQLLVLGNCPPPRWVVFMYCHEIATSTNAATSQSSLEAQLAKNAKCESCLRTAYMYQSFIFEAIVGIDSFSFASLPVQSKLPTATKASKCSKQEERKKSSLSYKMTFSTLKIKSHLTYSNSRLQHNKANTQNEV
jgi:hypothetical protein